MKPARSKPKPKPEPKPEAMTKPQHLPEWTDTMFRDAVLIIPPSSSPADIAKLKPKAKG